MYVILYTIKFFTISSYTNNSFHTMISFLISHNSLTVCDNNDSGYRVFNLISFVLYPSGIKYGHVK